MKLKDFNFRVWNPKERQYICSEVIKKYSGFEGLDDDCDVELWSGFCDTNSKKIYEGDIVEVWNMQNEPFTDIVIYSKTNGFILKEDLGNLFNYGELEVLGNIHENKDLLNKEG